MQGRTKLNVNDILSKKGKEKISILTAYEYSTARICDRADIDILLVGDSAGMVVLGYASTMPVSMQEMMIFCSAVARGTKRALIVGDMPFGSYQVGPSVAVENAVQLIKAGCDAVKLEGSSEIIDTIEAIVDAGIPVMGHIGLRPQTSSLWEGYKLQGRTKEGASKLIEDANVLEKAGVFSIVLEMVASEVADAITKSLSIPTIGIGSGPSCDGQVLVLHDMLGIYEDIRPRFVKRYAELSKEIFDAVSSYNHDIKAGTFPEESNTFHMDAKELDKWKNESRI
ncbi:MAG: 3-methyl-2-oxobutanoate hydroxymethyltransferase [Thermoproteota archaeon]|nr:3-methyl-2-oxobutanoate hydroxymethyltransferase [Thermoproteota archaeon]